MMNSSSSTEESNNDLRFLLVGRRRFVTRTIEYRKTVHLLGAAKSPGCPKFGLKHVARQQKTDYPLASALTEKHFYVDDGLVSIPSADEAKKLITESQEEYKRGGLHLHKFNSDQGAALSGFDPSERAANVELLGFGPTLSECSRQSVADQRWLIKVKDDTFIFNISLKDQPSTLVVVCLSPPLFTIRSDSLLLSV